MFERAKKLLSKGKHKALGLIMTVTAVLGSAVSAFAEASDVSTEMSSVGTELLSQFTTAAGTMKTVVLGIIGVAMVVILVKLTFKQGVAFFKNATNK